MQRGTIIGLLLPISIPARAVGRFACPCRRDRRTDRDRRFLSRDEKREFFAAAEQYLGKFLPRTSWQIAICRESADWQRPRRKHNMPQFTFLTSLAELRAAAPTLGRPLAAKRLYVAIGPCRDGCSLAGALHAAEQFLRGRCGGRRSLAGRLAAYRGHGQAVCSAQACCRVTHGPPGRRFCGTLAARPANEVGSLHGLRVGPLALATRPPRSGHAGAGVLAGIARRGLGRGYCHAICEHVGASAGWPFGHDWPAAAGSAVAETSSADCFVATQARDAASGRGEVGFELHKHIAADEVGPLLERAMAVEDRSWKDTAATSIRHAPGIVEFML